MRGRFLVLAGLLFALTWAGDVRGQQGPTLSVDPATLTLPPDSGPFEVRVLVDEITALQGLGGYTLVMSYDTKVLQAQSITDSGYAASTGNPVICPASEIDEERGSLGQLCLTVPVLGPPAPGPQTSEPQVLATVTFTVVGEGTTTLDLSQSSLIDPQGTNLNATTTNGQVTVGSASPPPTEASAREPDEEGGGSLALPLTLGIGIPAAVALLGAVGLLFARRGRPGRP